MSNKNSVKFKKCLKDEFDKTSLHKNSRIIFFPFFRVLYDISHIFKSLRDIILFLYFLISKPIKHKVNEHKVNGGLFDQRRATDEVESALTKKTNKLLSKNSVLFLINNIPFALVFYMVHNMNLPLFTKIIFVVIGVVLLLTNLLILRRMYK